MGYGQTLTAHGAEGTPGFFTEYDKLRTRFNAYTTVQASVTDTDFAGGADPSGVADSGAAIAACWAAAAPYSMIIYPPSTSGQATYRTTTALVHPAKPLFHSAPRGGAVIKNTGTGNVWESNGADNWTVDGLTFDGNYPTRTSGRALQLEGSVNFRLRNVRVQNSGSFGVAIIGGCQTFSLENFTIDTTRDSGMWFGAEGSGAVERGWIRDGYLTNTNLGNGVGHAGVQAMGYSGGTATVPYRRMHFRDVIIDGYTRVGWGIDYMTDSFWENCEARDSHTGEAFALTGNSNKIFGGRYGESTGAAGILLWSWVGNGQDNRDTTIADVLIPGPVSPQGQGIALVPAENNVAFRDIDIHGVRARGWNYGVQNYNTPGPKTGITIAASVVIHDSNLRDNATGQTLADTAGWTLRNNVP